MYFKSSAKVFDNGQYLVIRLRQKRKKLKILTKYQKSGFCIKHYKKIIRDDFVS